VPLNWQATIARQYPLARPISKQRKQLRQWLQNEHGVQIATTLRATSFCADDIIASKILGRSASGPFTAGGLGGLPYGGVTAFSAFAHHVPDGGTALILYGPHIGITRDGQWGKLLRRGQKQVTKACGSLMAALKALRAGKPTNCPLAADDDDLQQSRLVQLLAPRRQRILAAASPELEVTEAAYDLSHAMISRLVARVRKQFHCRAVALVGGVAINTDPDQEDWFEIRHQSCFTVG